MARKLEEKEKIHLSKQITELKKLHKKMVAEDKEVNVYTFMVINENMQRCIDNYKMELSE